MLDSIPTYVGTRSSIKNGHHPMVHEKNNFDFLRIFAAYLVLFSHQFSLTGLPQPGLGNYQSLGGLALNIFFTVSGYLVGLSWIQDPNPLRFALRRFLRIWPGLAVMVVLVAMVWGPLVGRLGYGTYFTDPMTLKFFKNLWLSYEYRLPGVFDNNPTPFVNGSLWTLIVEVRWYLFLMIFGLTGLIRLRFPLLLIFVAMMAKYFFIYDVEAVSLHGGDRWWNTELGLFFVAGLCVAVYRDFCTRHSWQVAVGIVLISAALFGAHYRYASYTMLTAYGVIWFGARSTPFIRSAGRFGDISYGVYIYAFVVQQTLIGLTGDSLGITSGLALAALSTGLVAWVSWHFVEEPALRLKRALRRPESGRSALA